MRFRQHNVPSVGSDVKYISKRQEIAELGDDPATQRAIQADVALLTPFDQQIRHLEADIEKMAQEHYAKHLNILQSIPGVGPIISLTVLLEMDHIERFDIRQQFCSYARLIPATQESGGKIVGVGNRKAGNAWLKWAFSEAAVLSAQKNERIGNYLTKLESKLGKSRALGALAHKLGRTMYYLLKQETVFDVDKFLRH
jgi:transposase